MKTWNLTVGPKGQITLPVEIRRKLDMNPKATVTVVLDDDDGVQVISPRARLHAMRTKYPPAYLPQPMTWAEVKATAREEVAQNLWNEMHPPDEP